WRISNAVPSRQRKPGCRLPKPATVRTSRLPPSSRMEADPLPLFKNGSIVRCNLQNGRIISKSRNSLPYLTS
ncbi:MAG: hypothetical protein, partial [Olavius algarvensis Gamma 1 endosymbiont]